MLYGVCAMAMLYAMLYNWHTVPCCMLCCMLYGVCAMLYAVLCRWILAGHSAAAVLGPTPELLRSFEIAELVLCRSLARLMSMSSAEQAKGFVRKAPVC